MSAPPKDEETANRLRFLRRVCDAELVGLSRIEALRMIGWLEFDLADGAPLPESDERLDALAHEIWAAAQLVPGEGIVDGVDRIVTILKGNGNG